MRGERETERERRGGGGGRGQGQGVREGGRQERKSIRETGGEREGERASGSCRHAHCMHHQVCCTSVMQCTHHTGVSRKASNV